MLFGAASCQQENLPEGANGEAVVSLAVALPNPATKVIGDGTNVDILYYEVWSDNNGQLGNKLTYGSVERTTAKVFDLDLTLLSDQTYHFLFWAQVDGKDYYTVTDLTNVTVNYDNAIGNDESRAAFYAHKSFLVEGALNETIMLKRPFAQLNFGTSTLKSDLQKDDVTVNASKITVKGPATAFNVATGLGSDKATEDVVFTADKAFDLNPEMLSVSGTDYHYLSMNYFLVPEGESVTLGVDADFTTSFGTVKHQFVNVPVAQNYRTNIIGDLLFNKADFQIVVDEKFEDQADEWEGGKYGVLDGKRYVKVETIDEFNAAFANENIDMIILLNDLELTESLTKAASDPILTIPAGKELILDLNGKKLSATSSQTGTNYNMFDVRGTLTVKNGTLEYKHEGENMAWNNSTNLFNVTDGGILNLEGVTAKNLGGSDMGFVAHLNNWGEVTLNVEDCTLESNYVAVRVFNSGNDMNNVTIKNSTLKGGSYAFWVHNYTLADYGNDEDITAQHQTLLNFDILNGTNVFEGKNSTPIRYGFTNSLYFDANGVQQVSDAASLAAILTSDKENIAVSLGADIDLPITSLGQQTGGSGEYKLGGENTKAITIDLNGKKLNVTTTYWSALGAKNDNALVTIKNGTMTSTGNSAGTWNAWDLRFSNCNYAFEGVDFEKAVALDNVGRSTSMKKVTITDTHNADTYGLWITAEGQTVTLEDCVIDMTPAFDGRGIKIDNQYVDDQKKVTLNVKNVTFKTEEKAAILVKSAAGAEINASELDITEVAADQTFAVWVDEEAAEDADKVVVDGALKKVEGDDKTVVANTADAAGEAIAAGATNIYLSEGTYVIPAAAKGKTVTFIGTGDPEDVQVVVTKVGTVGENCDYGLDGSTVTFENITITTNSSTYIGYARCNGTYNNCIINGTYTLYGNSVFNNCTLNVSGDVYNIWTWGAPTAEFNSCTFNSDGKALLLYGQANTKLTVNNCIFNDNGGLTDLKAAIEIGNDYNKSYELIVNETIVNGYEINDKGINTGTTLWANKNSMPKDKLNVVVDGVDVY